MKNLLTLEDIQDKFGIPKSTLGKWAREKTIEDDWISFVEKEREDKLSPLSTLDQPTSELGGQDEF